MSYFKKLQLSEWRQFQNIDIDLSAKVTILTGQNGCGKTTILNTLGHHFGWNVNFVSTPYLSKRGAKRMWSDLFGFHKRYFGEEEQHLHQIGSILYDNGYECKLEVNTQTEAQYKPGYKNQREVIGMHIPSHRPAAVYHNINTIPTNPTSALKFYRNYQSLLNQTYTGNNRPINPGKVQKESLISLATFGEGNTHVQSNEEYVRIFENFQDVLKVILPNEIGFERIEIRMPEVVLITKSGDFSLDAMSGGINALFGIAWQIHMFGVDNPDCTITIDEPENHLHPSMQRSLLPSLAKAFPHYRFIIASHSPFVVTSFPQANVYALLHNENSKVTSRKIESFDLSGTPNKVLREILDVSSNLPLWVEDDIKSILSDNNNISDNEKARMLMQRLKELGISDVKLLIKSIFLASITTLYPLSENFLALSFPVPGPTPAIKQIFSLFCMFNN